MHKFVCSTDNFPFRGLHEILVVELVTFLVVDGLNVVQGPGANLQFTRLPIKRPIPHIKITVRRIDGRSHPENGAIAGQYQLRAHQKVALLDG